MFISHQNFKLLSTNFIWLRPVSVIFSIFKFKNCYISYLIMSDSLIILFSSSNTISFTYTIKLLSISFGFLWINIVFYAYKALNWPSFLMSPSDLYWELLAYLILPLGLNSNSRNSCPNLPLCPTLKSNIQNHNDY